MRMEYKPKFNIPLNPYSINQPSQKVYITYNKEMTIKNLVGIYLRLDMITHKS